MAEKEKYYVVNFSGGKDSTAMLLRLLELGEPIDEVIFCDTYKEFPQMYKHIEKIKKVVEDAGIKFTTLKGEKSFDYYMFEHKPKRKNNQNENHKHPLVEWGWTEQQALEYCYSCGYDWEGLYKYFNRVSCWCCPLQSLEDLRNMRKHFPELWQELIDMDNRTWRKFKPDYTVEELDRRFSFEEEWLKEGKSIRSREFFRQLKILL